MARSEVITLSPAGAEIPGQRCEAPRFSFFVSPWLLKEHRFDEALRAICDDLSAQGIRNFIHYDWGTDSRTVETFDPPAVYVPVINHTTNSIELREHDLCETQ
jgi:hypothetical protein